MIKNYFKTMWRNMFHHKTYTSINIIGLAIGIAACLLIFLVVHFETSFDNFHSKKDKIYRVVTAYKSKNGFVWGSGVPLPVAEGLRTDFPQIKNVAAIFRYGGHFK